MKIAGYPNCCTCLCIYSFGESLTSGTGAFEVSYDAMKYEFEQKIQRNRQYLLTAITNSDQKTASEVLKDLGFEHSTWMKKRQHPQTKLRLWWKRPDSTPAPPPSYRGYPATGGY